MATLGQKRDNVQYLSIGETGPTGPKKEPLYGIKKEVSEDTIGAIARSWQVGNESGVKYELYFPYIEGKITDVKLIEKEFNKKTTFDIQLTFDNELVVKTKSTGKAGSAIMRTLPEVDLTQPVKMTPYSYIPKGKTKESTGVSFKQGENFDVKVGDHYYDFDKGEAKNGIPVNDFDWATVEDWEKDKFWAEMDKFLRKQVEEKVIPNVPEFVAEEVTEEQGGGLEEAFEKEVDPSEIDF